MLISAHISILEAALPAERRRLVRLCAQLTGNADVAEDLAQETLLEAWRQVHKLHDPRGYAPWLSAIARNICLRWRQRNQRELPLLSRSDRMEDGTSEDALHAHPDAFDLEVELDRDELATLLDRALELLPPETRTALIARYVEATPLAEVAIRLGLSESGLKARLHRGKLSLRRVLLQDFPDEAAAYGLLDPDLPTGQETRIWCLGCGQRKLYGIFDRERGELSLGCPRCTPGQPTGQSWARLPKVFEEVKGYRAALSRQMSWVHAYMWQALDGQPVACVYCGGSTTLHLGPPTEDASKFQGRRGLHVHCGSCQAAVWTALGALALSSPAGRRFWRRYPRIHTLPDREIEVNGAPAVVTSYQERAGEARFDVVFARNTLAVLDIYGAPAGEEA